MSVRKLKPVTPAQRFRIVNGLIQLLLTRQRRAYLFQGKILEEEIIGVK